MLEGNKILFRYALALLYTHKQVILEQNETISIFKHLKNAVKCTFDVEGLTKVFISKIFFAEKEDSGIKFYLIKKVAFETLKPFPSRKEISSKQAYYNRILVDAWQKRQMAKNYYTEQEKLVFNSFKLASFKYIS